MCYRTMEWSVLVSDADPWVMYRVFVAGLLYIYIPDTYRILAFSYMLSSLSFVLSFGLVFMQGSMVHHFFTYPVAVLVGTFVSQAVGEKPCEYPTLHVASTLFLAAAGFYGPLGYPLFMIPYVVLLLIAGMRRWAFVSGASMVLTGAMIPLHSPLVSLSAPVVVLFVYGWFEDIYHDTPLEIEV